MSHKLSHLVVLMLLFASCGATKNTASETKKLSGQIVAPEGIEFKTVTNYKDFASVNIPISVKGFKENTDVNDARFPLINYNKVQVLIWPNVKDNEGSLEEQFKQLYRALYIKKKSTDQVSFTKKNIGDYEVALVEIYNELSGKGYKSLRYGYLVKNGNKAALFFIKDGYFGPDNNIEAFKEVFNEAMIYTIKTLNSKNKFITTI